MNQAYYANLSTAGYRADNPRAQTLMSRAEERQYLEYRTTTLKDAGLEFTQGYKNMMARLTQFERHVIEMDAARRAYAAGLGAGEWEAFLSDGQRTRLAEMEGAA